MLLQSMTCHGGETGLYLHALEARGAYEGHEWLERRCCGRVPAQQSL
jgi:hypothetical protein